MIIGGVGYVGSALDRYLTDNLIAVDTLDAEERGNRSNPGNVQGRYQDLEVGDLDEYDAVIWVAGRSSVKSATESPIRAFDDNLADLGTLTRKLTGQKFLWASSGSVLSKTPASNIYDATKCAAELVMPHIYPNSYALRFGTVCGPAQNLRLDLMINKMVYDAETKHEITVANGHVQRPILGISDLCAAIHVLLDHYQVPGTYQLCSFTETVETIGRRVAKYLGVPLKYDETTVAYDFDMQPSLIAGWEPRDTVETIVRGLLQFHQDTGLDTLAA